MQYGGPVFSTVPLPLHLWALCLGLGGASWIVRAGLAAIPTPRYEGGPLPGKQA